MEFDGNVESLDDFLNGRVKVFQPKSGFRAGMDSVLLAAAVSPHSNQIVELGCGSGVAACCVLADRASAHAVMVDIQSEALEYAKRNLKKNGFLARAHTLLLDVTAKGNNRAEAGLQTDCFSSVIANPPFFLPQDNSISRNASRERSRQMPRTALDKWVQTAAASAAPKGEIIFIHVSSALPELLSAFEKRFGDISLLPIAPRSGEKATRVLIRGIKGSRAPLSLLPPLILHAESGREFLPLAESIFRGRNRLHW